VVVLKLRTETLAAGWWYHSTLGLREVKQKTKLLAGGDVAGAADRWREHCGGSGGLDGACRLLLHYYSRA